MIFLTTWQPTAFDRMQDLVRDFPQLRTEFIYALRSLTTELNRRGDVWGESRHGRYRLGFIGVLQVLIRLDEDDPIVEVVDLKLRRNALPG